MNRLGIALVVLLSVMVHPASAQQISAILAKAGVLGIAVYDRHDWHSEEREALSALIERIVNPPSDNVVPLRAAAE